MRRLDLEKGMEFAEIVECDEKQNPGAQATDCGFFRTERICEGAADRRRLLPKCPGDCGNVERVVGERMPS